METDHSSIVNQTCLVFSSELMMEGVKKEKRRTCEAPVGHRLGADSSLSFEFTPTEMFKSCLKGDGRKSILHRNMEPRKGVSSVI